MAASSKTVPRKFELEAPPELPPPTNRFTEEDNELLENYFSTKFLTMRALDPNLYLIIEHEVTETDPRGKYRGNEQVLMTMHPCKKMDIKNGCIEWDYDIRVQTMMCPVRVKKDLGKKNLHLFEDPTAPLVMHFKGMFQCLKDPTKDYAGFKLMDRKFFDEKMAENASKNKGKRPAETEAETEAEAEAEAEGKAAHKSKKQKA